MTLNAIRKNSKEENSFDYLMQSAVDPIEDLNTHWRFPCCVDYLRIREAFSTLRNKIVQDGLN